MIIPNCNYVYCELTTFKKRRVVPYNLKVSCIKIPSIFKRMHALLFFIQSHSNTFTRYIFN